MSRAGAARDALDRTGAELTWDMIEVALSAADAVMFSDEAVERAAESLWIDRPMRRTPDGAPWPYEEISIHYKNRHRQQARAVIAALKGADR